MSREAHTLTLAAEVAATLAEHGIQTAVIGAVALAVHGYPRATEDIDLATSADLDSLRASAADLARRGYTVRIGEPDAEDPLGGVVTVTSDETDPVQIVNYANPYRPGSGGLADEAVETAVTATLGTLAVVDPVHLIALKLYAGGAKSKLDVVELLARNPEIDVDEIRRVCARFGLEDEWNALCAS